MTSAISPNSMLCGNKTRKPHDVVCQESEDSSRVFAAMFSSCKYESALGIISLHATKAGAYKAVRKHKMEEREEDKGIGWDLRAWAIKELIVYP